MVKTEIVERLYKDKERAEQYFASIPHLQPEDIAESVVYVLSAPPHVQVGSGTFPLSHYLLTVDQCFHGQKKKVSKSGFLTDRGS